MAFNSGSFLLTFPLLHPPYTGGFFVSFAVDSGAVLMRCACCYGNTPLTAPPADFLAAASSIFLFQKLWTALYPPEIRYRRDTAVLKYNII